MDCPHVCMDDLQELDVSRMWSLENMNIPVDEYLLAEERDAIRQAIDSAIKPIRVTKFVSLLEMKVVLIIIIIVL